MALKVLIDHSVRERAVQGETGFVFQEGEVLGQRISYLQLQTRYPPPKRTDWLQPEIDILPKIAQLVRSKRIQAFTTFELEAEAFRVARIGDPHPIDPFRDCTIEVPPDPFHRSKSGLDGEQHMSKDNVIDHCKRLLNLTEESAERLIKMFDRNPRYNLSQFGDLCAVGAWH